MPFNHKTVVLASAVDSSFTLPLYRAFRNLGCKVVVFDYRNILGNIRTNPAILVHAFHKKLLSNQQPLRKRVLNTILLNYCQKHKPDYLFVVKGDGLTKETITDINRCGTQTLLWQVDPLLHEPIWSLAKATGKAYNVFITCEPGKEINKLKHIGVTRVLYMLGAADGTVMCNLQNTPKKYDVCLVGTYHPRREQYLQTLADFDVHIWGWGDWQSSRLHNHFEGKPLTQAEMFNVYSKSKIIINISRATGSSNPTNLRPFEAAQVGAFILVEKRPYLQTVFEIGKEIDIFNSPSQLKAKVEYYLSHDKVRQEMAQKLFTTVQKKHTYEIRLETLFHDIQKFR